jgi:glyoxylase-like metal-dependent hydrolase (beta-lactamase superfamily II)
MIIRAEGAFGSGISISGHFIYPGYLIKGRINTLMIEAGLSMLGPIYIKDINNFFGSSTALDYILVTHSHYDHLGALSYLKRSIPSVRIGASPRVDDLMQKESVISTMNFLSGQLLDYFKDLLPELTENVSITPLELDLRLQEGDIIDIGGMSCHVYETPGHTRDHLSYYIPEISMLFPGEALGNPIGDGTEVKVEFVTSYEDYMNSIEKLKGLNPEVIALSHVYVYTGQDAQKFMARTSQATVEYRRLIEQYLDEAHGGVESATDLMVKAEYDGKGNIAMERNAYIANLKAQIRAVSEIGLSSGMSGG